MNNAKLEITEQSIKEVRTISYLLYPPMLEENGLRSAVAWYLDGLAKRTEAFRAICGSTPVLTACPYTWNWPLFRVLQEELDERLSATPAARLPTIDLGMRDGNAVLAIRDSGVGLPARMWEELRPDLLGGGGVGLRGMRERMLQIGGTLEIESASSGTTVIATVPIQPSGAVVIPIESKKLRG